MVEREVALMVALILIMGGVLVFLLLLPSQRFMGNLDAAVERVASMLPTTTTTSTSSTTSTTASTSTTSTTASTTTETTSTSTTSTSTSTTMSGRRCGSNEDCGGTVTELKCKKNSVYSYTTTYTCRRPGGPESYCLGKTKEEVVEMCEVYEDCVDGTCVRLYGNECDQQCDLAGYDMYYCRDGECSEGDVRINVRECSGAGSTCCCVPDATTSTTTTTSSTTTTTQL